jgi:glycosyltransferase involved in cell wall biosynthesis
MSAPPRRIVVLESKVAAHSGYYLEYLARHWQPRSAGQELVFVLPPTFGERHRQAHELLASADSQARGIGLRSLDPDRWRTARDPFPGLRWSLRIPRVGAHLRFRLLYLSQWLALRRTLVALEAQRALIMSLDDLLLPTLLAPPPPSVEVAGILFKPSFHYGALENDERGAVARFKARLDLYLLRRFARRPGRRLFSLDSLATSSLRPLLGDRVATLPEPARGYRPAPEQVDELAGRLGIDRTRTCFLLLGSLDARRGVEEVLSAIDQLGAEHARSATLLLAGTLPPRDRRLVRTAIAHLRSSSACEVVLAEGTIPEQELMLYFHLADVVLVTHRRHVGSSGTLLHAAAAGRPVVATRAGLIGHQVRSRRLGATVDSASPRSIADGLRAALSTPPDDLFDAASAARFAAENTPERYAETLLDALTSPSAWPGAR